MREGPPPLPSPADTPCNVPYPLLTVSVSQLSTLGSLEALRCLLHHQQEVHVLAKPRSTLHPVLEPGLGPYHACMPILPPAPWWVAKWLLRCPPTYRSCSRREHWVQGEQTCMLAWPGWDCCILLKSNVPGPWPTSCCIFPIPSRTPL